MGDVSGLLYSEEGLELTREFEGLRLEAYQDSAGVWTVGYGHTGAEVHGGLTITRDQAEEFLRGDLEKAAAAVRRLIKVEVTQGQFDALVDFAFNLGAGRLASSTLLRELNAGNGVGAAEQFARWSCAGGAVLPGLLRRRRAEAARFQESALRTAVET